MEVHLFSAASFPQAQRVYRSASVLADLPADDLAVVRFAASEPVVPLTICPAEEASVELNSQVITIGCSHGEAPTCNLDRIVDYHPILRPEAKNAVLSWKLRGSSLPGRSGGPLVDGRGYLLGIASGVGDGQSYYVHLSVLRDFLDKSGLAWLSR
jgi:hypothetical protein